MTREEAIRRIKAWNLDSDDMEVLSAVVPELRESEDEKTRKGLIKLLTVASDAYLVESTGIKKDAYLAWLEKQKEQNPAEWSNTDKIGWDEAFACVTRAEKAAKNEEELQNAVTAEKWLKEIKFKYSVHPVKQEWNEEDENKMGVIIRLVEQNSGFPDRAIKEYVAWLKSLKNRGNFLKSNTNSPSWSEEDELNIGWLIAYLKGESAGEYYDEMMRESLADWLKSLRPQPRWKPSEEQINRLVSIVAALRKDYCDDMADFLASLYEQLKKL